MVIRFNHKSATSLNSLEPHAAFLYSQPLCCARRRFSDKSYSYRVYESCEVSSSLLLYLESHACPAIVRVIVTDLPCDTAPMLSFKKNVLDRIYNRGTLNLDMTM